MAAFDVPLRLALDHALDHLRHLDANRVAPGLTIAEVRARLAKPLLDEGLPPDRVVSELVRDSEGAIVGCAGGRFFGWVIGGALPAALAADWLSSAWDQAAGLYASGPAAAVVEEVAGEWLKELLGIPAVASVAFVTGCQMAHATCLAAARHAVLARAGWDVEEKGLWGAPPIRIVSSTEHHGSIDRAVRLLGMGRQSIITIPADDQGRLPSAGLERVLSSNTGPAIVVLQAGDLNIGAYDDFESLIPIARRSGAWVHIDGAFGLWANASPRFRHLLRGAGGADSWAADGHKWLNVPYDSGYAFVRNREAHRAAIAYRAPYLTYDEDARDPVDWTPEWSRRARGFPTYAAIRQLGRNGIASLVERCCDSARVLVRRIGELPGAEVLAEPAINQGLVRFGGDRRTDSVIAAILAGGEAFFGGTTWRGRRAMRVSVCNWQTGEEHLDRAVAAVARALQDA